MNVISLLKIAKSLPIDTDHLVHQSPFGTQLLLRLGGGQSYPDEMHPNSNETIMVMSGVCVLKTEQAIYNLDVGDQITVPAGIHHCFLPESECCLNIRFESHTAEGEHAGT